MGRSGFEVAFSYYLKRMTRDFFGLGIFIVLPLVIISILSLIYGHNSSQEIYVRGYNMITTHIATGMMLLFQLNGGAYLLNYMHVDFGKAMKWRLKASPCPTQVMAFACIAACTVFTVLQGVLIVLFTSIFMKAYWGNMVVTLLVIILSSLCSQLINITVFFSVKNLGVAEGLTWLVTWVMAALGGFMFGLPENPFFDFMERYGTPFSLGQTAIRSSGFLESSYVAVGIAFAGLTAIVGVLAGIVIFLGRRKLT